MYWQYWRFGYTSVKENISTTSDLFTAICINFEFHLLIGGVWQLQNPISKYCICDWKSCSIYPWKTGNCTITQFKTLWLKFIYSFFLISKGLAHQLWCYKWTSIYIQQYSFTKNFIFQLRIMEIKYRIRYVIHICRYTRGHLIPTVVMAIGISTSSGVYAIFLVSLHYIY